MVIAMDKPATENLLSDVRDTMSHKYMPQKSELFQLLQMKLCMLPI